MDKYQCDESDPECNNCIAFGSKCPGSLRGTLFIDMSAVVRQSVTKSCVGQNEDTTTRGKRRPIPYGTAKCSALPSIPGLLQRDKTLEEAWRLPTTYQPS